MNIQQLYEFCLNKKGVTEHFPFDEDTLVFKVGGKMFCLTSLSEWEKGTPSLNLKCDPEKAILLREEFQAIKPGYHMSKVAQALADNKWGGRITALDRKSTRLNSSHLKLSRMPSSA